MRYYPLLNGIIKVVTLAVLACVVSGLVRYDSKSPFHHSKDNLAVDADGNVLSLSEQVSGLKEYIERRRGSEYDVNYVVALARCAQLIQELDLQNVSPRSNDKEIALSYFDLALSEASNFPEIESELLFFWFLRKAILLQAMGKYDDAILSFDKATEFSKSIDDLAISLFHKGNSLLHLNRTTDALNAFRRSLEIQPSNLSIYSFVVKCHRILKDIPSPEKWYHFVNEMENALALTSKKKGNNDIPTDIYWALAETNELSELYGDAIRWLTLARRSERKVREALGQYNDRYVSESARRLQVIKGSFTSDFVRKHISIVGSNTTVPVFIVGLPRCGSTLLESMLVSHKNIETISEESIVAAEMIEFAMKAGNQSQSGKVPQEDGPIAKTLSDLYRLPLFQTEEVDLNDAEQAGDYKINIRKRADDIESKMFVEILKRINQSGGKKVKRIIDKTLSNYWNIGTILLLFPRAVIINMYRNPGDHYLALIKQKFAHPSLSWTLDDEHLLASFSGYVEVMRHYLHVMPSNRIINLAYEDLVSNPASVLKQLVSKLGLPFDFAMLQYHNNIRHVATPSAFQVREAINNRSIGLVNKYLGGSQHIDDSFKEALNRLEAVIKLSADDKLGSLVTWPPDKYKNWPDIGNRNV
jgi:tetratricopeptide (TPR) repeat protein